MINICACCTGRFVSQVNSCVIVNCLSENSCVCDCRACFANLKCLEYEKKQKSTLNMFDMWLKILIFLLYSVIEGLGSAWGTCGLIKLMLDAKIGYRRFFLFKQSMLYEIWYQVCPQPSIWCTANQPYTLTFRPLTNNILKGTFSIEAYLVNSSGVQRGKAGVPDIHLTSNGGGHAMKNSIERQLWLERLGGIYSSSFIWVGTTLQCVMSPARFGLYCQ